MSIIAMKILRAIWGNPLFLIPVVVALTWTVKGVVEEFECSAEARVAALQVELANERTIATNNKALRAAAQKDVAGLKIEIQKRKERTNALIEQFKDSDCSFSDAELNRMR